MKRYFYTSADGIIKSDDKFTNTYLVSAAMTAGGLGIIIGVLFFCVIIIPLLIYVGTITLLEKAHDGLKKIGCNTGKNRNL